MTAGSLAQTKPIDPMMIALATGMKVRFSQDAAACRAVDRAIEILGADLPYEFDGTELRVLSYSRSQQGIWHVTDGTSCTCEGSRFQYCRHRMLFRLKLAEMALTDPMMLRLRIIEQIAPVDDEPGNFLDLDFGAFDDYGDVAPVATAVPFLLQPSRETVPAPGSALETAQALADALFAA